MKFSKSILFFFLIVVNVLAIQCSSENDISNNEKELRENNLKEYEIFDALIRNLDPQINDAVECIRSKILENKLDPFNFPIIPLILNTKTIESNLLITKFQIDGLSSFELAEAVVSKNPFNLYVKLVVNIDNIAILFKRYRGFIRIMDMIHLYGDGGFAANFTNFHLDVLVNLKVKSLINPLAGIQIKNIAIDLDLFKTKIAITGLFNDPFMSKLISKQLSKALTAVAEGEKDRLNGLLLKTANTLIKEQINPFLGTKSTLEILAMANVKLCEPAVAYINDGIDYIRNFTNTNPDFDVEEYLSQASDYYDYHLNSILQLGVFVYQEWIKR